MKAIILTISAGGGHHTATKAIDEHLKTFGIETITIDAYKYFNTLLSNTVEKGYLISTKYIPKIYGRFYRMAEKRTEKETSVRMGAMGSSLVFKKFAKFIQEQNADVIITTHLFGGELLTAMREKGMINSLLIGVVTDFTVHPFWEETNLDYYVTASELLDYQMYKKGITKDRILPFGIPIHPKFARKTDKSEARERLGLLEKTTVMVMAGSMGYGSVYKHIMHLDSSPLDFQIICVCGSNKKLKKQLDAYSANKNMIVYGFTTNVDLLMDASDYIITKPGGLSVSEALAKGLPLILIDPIPGQEDRNKEFLLNVGVAITATKTHPADEAIYQLEKSDIRKASLDDIIKNIAKPDAGKKLGEFIVENIKRDR
ncbi:MAG: glycosyltransferase [Ruminococcaceae bacterium]|nr:glycosyltransferase [Oscillospiraceae bacterium]